MPDGFARKSAFIAGPTASGKSALALMLAEATGGEIVNADAIQVYADLDILSARPAADDLSRAPHHLYGFVDAATRYSAGRWARAALDIIASVHARERLAIVVGGTGLYFRALEGGLAPAPDVPAAISTEARARLDLIGLAAFRAEVLARDPAMARLAPADTQRHLRAWEIFEATGRPLSEWQSAAPAPFASAVARLILDPPREELYRRIEARFAAMAANGGLEEARRLADRRLDPALPAMKAVGAVELMRCLDGSLTLGEALALGAQNTRRLAKRQTTWFRNQTADWPRESEIDRGLAALIAQLEKSEISER